MGKLAVFKFVYLISIILTLAVVGLTIVAAATSGMDPQDHPFMAILGLMLPVLLIINLVLFVYWVFRFKYWVWFPLIAILANVEYIISMFQYSAASGSEGNLKVATFNIHNFNNEITGYTAKEVAKFMNNEGVDVICFQELTPNIDFTLDSLYQAYRAYPYQIIPALGNGSYRISIFSKYPVTDFQTILFPESANCGMWADIDVNGKKVRVFNVHMQTTSLNSQRAKLAKQQLEGNTNAEEEAVFSIAESIRDNSQKRARQADQVKSIMDSTQGPVILCGDFNDTPASYTYKVLKGDLIDGFKDRGNGYGYTFRGLHGLLRIDYIFYSPQIKGIDYYSPSKDWSDHNPVIAEIQL